MPVVPTAESVLQSNEPWSSKPCAPTPPVHSEPVLTASPVMPAAPASKGYAPGFAVDLMLKDLGLAQDVAAIAGLETPLGALAHQLYSAHQAAGNGGRDFSSIIQALRDRSPA